jgi:hypothetical protein
MDRATWESAFLAELLALRPYMARRQAREIAAAAYSGECEPVQAARDYHAMAQPDLPPGGRIAVRPTRLRQ